MSDSMEMKLPNCPHDYERQEGLNETAICRLCGADANEIAFLDGQKLQAAAAEINLFDYLVALRAALDAALNG